MTLSRLGAQTNAPTEDFVRARFPVTRFEEMPTPFAAVATDLQTGAAVVMRDEGDVAFAMRASCALPGWYVPVTDARGRQLIDGGLVANLPTSVARSLGAEVVVAVDVNADGAKFLGTPASVIGVLLQSIVVVQRTAVEHQRQLADVVISPAVGHLRWDEMERASRVHRCGHRGRARRRPRHKGTARTAARRSAALVRLAPNAHARDFEGLKNRAQENVRAASLFALHPSAGIRPARLTCLKSL